MTAQLTPELVLHGYRMGMFPMADDDDEIYWFSPDPRAVFELDRFHTPKSLRSKLRPGVFEIRIDAAFPDVMRACAERDEGTWINADIFDVYCELHARDWAHSVETWQDGALVGGLYGVAIGGAFFGESMFHRVRDASKVALVRLVERLRDRGFTLLDTQWTTPHLQRFGVVEIPRGAYLRRLKTALDSPCRFI